MQKKKAPGSASAAHKGGFETPRKVSKRIAAAGAQASVAAEESTAAEESARQSMVDMGFSSVDITAALERENFAFGQALIQLLNGLDEHRTKTDNKHINRFRRQGLKCAFIPKDEKALIGSSVFSQYEQRMFESFRLSVDVLDLGQYARRTSGACFWLGLAAGLAE